MSTSKEVARQEEAQDIAHLLAVFAKLEGYRRSEVMRAAVMELAEMRMPRATEDEREEWLIQLASDCLPRGFDAAALIARASAFDLDAIDTLCDGSALTVVLRSSHEDDEASAGMVEGYRSVCSMVSPGMMEPPDIEDCLGVHADPRDFRRPAEDDDESDDGWVIDHEAMQEAVDQECAECCARLLIGWRRAFFAALLADPTER